MTSGSISPNHREAITAVSSISGKDEYLYSTNHALEVAVISGGGSGTQYTEGDTTTPGVGNLSLGRYKLTPPSLTDGQMESLQLDSAGNLKVTGSLSVGGTTDNSAFTAGTSTGTPAMGFYHSTIDTVTDGRSAAVGITSKRALLVNLQTAAGVETGIAAAPLQVSLANTATNATAVKVDGTGGSFPISGTTTATQGTAAAVTAGWPVIQGQLADTTGTFTNGTQTTSVTASSLNGYETVTVSITGTYTVATAVFEVSDDGGTTWFGTQGARSDSATIESGYTTLTSTTRMWVIPINGGDSFRVRSTAVATGTVNVRISPTAGASADSAIVSLGAALPAGSAVIGALTANQSINNAQINGVTPLMGNGVTGTGSQRVTIASDNTAFSVNATLSAETTKVIGVTRTADGSGNLLTSTTNALDVNIKTSAATNISTNLAQVNGATTLAGNGVSGTGALRVSIASDSTGQVAPAANATATGTSIYNNTALSSTKAAVNASAGNLYGYHIYNPNAVVIYVQLFNVASASVTVGTTPPTAVLAIPAAGWADATPSVPITFGTALTIAATTTSTGSGTPTTALLCNIWYK